MPTRPKVVIADDNPILRMCVVDLLGSIALDLCQVDTAHALRSTLAAGRFDAVVTDVRMPGGSGLDVLRERRAAGDSTPFVVMTGSSPEEMSERVRGVDHVFILSKPFTCEELHAALASALGIGCDLRTLRVS